MNWMKLPERCSHYAEKAAEIISDHDCRFIRLAIEEARRAREAVDEPFGAVLVKAGLPAASGRNQVFTRNDPTYYTELGFLRDFCWDKGARDLSGYTLYSSYEPCVMCVGAIGRINPSRSYLFMPRNYKALWERF